MTDSSILFDRLVSGDFDPAPFNTVSLAFDLRQRSRLRVTVDSGAMAGESVGIELPRGNVMRAGTLLGSEAGVYLQVDAAPEKLIEVRADDTLTLTAIAYHLGNRHVPVQLGDQWLRLQQDHVLEQMVLGLGGMVVAIEAAFEPESGAYQGGGHHHHGDDHEHTPADSRHSPRIHDLADPGATT